MSFSRVRFWMPALATVGGLGLLLVTPGALRAEQPRFTATPTPGPAATPAPDLVRCSDVDGDGDVGVADGVLVLRAAADLETPCMPSTCDADGDGSITVADGVRVLSVAADLDVGFFGLACPPFTVVEDFFGFARFDFVRQPALGFCVPPSSVARAEIERVGARRYRASIFIAREGDPEDPACIPSGDTCVVEEPLPERFLSDSEVDVLRTAFSAVRLARSPEPICVLGLHFDPCVVNSATWDDVNATDFSCHVPRLLPDQVEALSQLLERLAAP